MMEVLLLLCACFYVGLSYDELEYGSSYTLRLHRKAQSLTFTPRYDESNVTILWKRDDPPASQDSRRKVMGSYYMINPLTQEDSGTYIMRDKDRLPLSVRTIRVVALVMTFKNTAGESFNFAFDLEPTSCHIYFITESDRVEHQIVRHGRLRPNLECQGFEMSGRCGVSNSNPQKSCSGRYEVRDSKGNRALVATVEVEALPPFDTKKIGMGIGIFFAVVGCCGCLKRCCCGKSSSKEEQPETPDEEPAVHYHDYDHESVGPRQPYPAQPSHTPTGLLINNPPTTVPPAYSEVFLAPAEPTVAPTVPVESDGQPRFELKGTSFSSAPPLSSDSPYGDVYTSDKLNFL
ncbi:uncharacterized protein [Pagrus major]|uniref:uncharacterized protein n=1 Tax=Pagrus major TaxID=143350 RepID=UPI003CC883C6